MTRKTQRCFEDTTSASPGARFPAFRATLRDISKQVFEKSGFEKSALLRRTRFLKTGLTKIVELLAVGTCTKPC